MRKIIVLIRRIGYIGMYVFLIVAALALISSQNALIVQKIQKPPVQKTVLLELFTSQGCSSCPPADAILAAYAASHDEQIIPISFHVDYWNRLGWTDPFSSNSYSSRQRWYGQHLPGHSVYTPQLVVNGKEETVGNNRKAVISLVQKELLVGPVTTLSIGEIVIDKNSVSFQYTTVNAGKDALLNIALVQKQVITRIKAGENDGVTVTNRNIVRSFNTQPLNGDGSAHVSRPTDFKNSDYALVVFVQDRNSLSVNAATFKEL